jgi:subtilisin family serine protease
MWPNPAVNPTDHIVRDPHTTTQGAKITSISWASQFSSTLFEEMKISDAAGHLFIAAAGNSDLDSDRCRKYGPYVCPVAVYPAAFDFASVISVGASDNNDERWGKSNYGATTVDLFAPGAGIVSTALGSEYAVQHGTSVGAGVQQPRFYRFYMYAPGGPQGVR